MPPLLDINDKISFNSQPTPFGPVSLVNASFSIGKESLAARVLRQFTGDLLLASGGAKGKFSIGLEATSGGVDVDEDDTFAEVKLPGGSFGGVSLSVSAGGLPCRVAGYFSGFSQLCGGGVTVVLGLGISGAFGTGVSIQYPLPDIDGDGRPDPAIESVNGEFSLEAPEFIELDLGSFFLDGFLREVPSLSPSGEAAPARTTESENESSASVTSPSTNSREDIGFSTIDGIGDDPRSYYRFYLDGEETEVSGITNSMGEFNTVLPPSTGFRLFVYTPSSNRFRIEIGETSESGSRTSVTTTAEFFGGVDSDNDGIPDVGEITIGTSDQNRDTDGDGISDAAEIAQGLDPLGGRGFPTGVIASLPLLGEALEITVVGGTNDATRQTAFLATGSHGLAIVDASKFNNPIVLGQLDLPGQNTGVAVDPTLSWAAVGSSEGLHFVDVSDPMMPRLELTVDGRFGQVEWIGGIAYAVQGQNILGFDPRSGERLSSEIVPGSGQVTMASEGGKLYAFSFGSNTLSVLEPRGSQINVLGELPGIAISNIVNVTVGNDLVVLGGAGSSTPNGLVTIDVSNPADMRIISGPDFFFDARGLARNGSGLALVGSEIPGVGVGIYGISDPENTNDFRQQIPTSGPALSVAIASGIAFVASERSGLQVINYLPFDTAGQAPTVALALNVDAVDIGPDEPGIQVLEGSTIPVSVDSTDDVQVRNVELLVDGQVVQNAVSFPFNLAAVAPVLGDGMEKAEFTIQARATDTGGNTALSDLITVDMRPDTFPPIIDRFDVNLPDEDPEVPGSQLIGKANLRVFFAASDTGSLKTVELLLNGEVIAVEDRPVGVIQFATASLAAGEAFRDVELRLRATDRAGNATLSDPLAYRVVPDTFPPNISTINLADGDVNSTGLFSFNLGFSEPMDLNTLTSAVLVLNGPIGSIEPESVLLNANGRGMQVRYQLPVEGAFTLTIDAPALTDRAGNPLGDAPVSIDFDVQEQASPLFPGRRFASGEVPRSATTGNFNNDGVTDLVTANAGSDDVSVLLGNGDGTFASQQRFAAGASPMSLTTGDFNGDGVTDVVTANAGSDDVSVLLGNGDGTFALQQRFGVGDEPSFVTTGDFNGDGVNDLVTANRKSDDVSMLLGNGDGTFASQQHFPAGADPFSLTTGDFNADGLIDLVTANRFGNNVSVLLGNGDGTFASQQQFPVGDGPLSVTTGDFNADGLTDLVTANALSDDVSVLLGSGDGTFATQQRFGVANGPRSLTTGDFNTDGLTDLVTTNPNSDDISVLLGNGDGTFASQQRFATGNAASSATTGDFNGDGTTDVVTANAGSDDVSVLLGNEDGTFASQQRYTAGNVASSAAMGDFDADGVIDLVATNANSDDISVLLGDGDGTFASQQRYDAGDGPVSVKTGDFNGDGVTDLVTANQNSDDVSVLLGNGDGTFASQQRFTADEGPFSVTTGDFNGDGVTDLVTANLNSNDVSVLLGSGDGTFASQQRFAAGDGPVSVKTGDVNGDGVTDLVTANLNSNDVSVLLGSGDGTFASQQRFSAGEGTFSVTTGDFNADGLIDLVTANRFGNNVSVLLGNGDGTFASQQQFPVGDGPLSVTTGDFNADGLTDLITANRFGDNVSVLLGNGDGTFVSDQRFGVSDDPVFVTTGDINADGLTDLVTANFSDSISVLLNQPG
ncbi:MAG: FG-GAP-like repeat-containing protein [Planctomycetota bacterium]